MYYIAFYRMGWFLFSLLLLSFPCTSVSSSIFRKLHKLQFLLVFCCWICFLLFKEICCLRCSMQSTEFSKIKISIHLEVWVPMYIGMKGNYMHLASSVLPKIKKNKNPLSNFLWYLSLYYNLPFTNILF